MSTSPSPALPRRWELAILAATVVVGLSLRCVGLGERVLLNDEGESALNALTIFEGGLPRGAYQNLPIYENALITPWPEHAEYEFRDSSYTATGLAVYHGWLPLYSIAASLAAIGIEPDPASDTPRVLHAPDAMRRRAWAIRLPAVLFAGLFLVAMYHAGKAFYGPDAGLLALGLAAFTPNAIWFGQHARYYSAAIALSACCLLLVWRMYRQGQWRDFLWGALAFVLLFHSHSISFAALCAGSALLLPGIVQHDQAAKKMLATGGLILLGVLPWAWLSGFFAIGESVPSARELLVFPDDYWIYPATRKTATLLLALIVGGLVAGELLKSRLPARIAEPWSAARGPAWFLVGVIVAAYFCFLLLMPAASLFLPRLSINYFSAALLLVAIVAAAVLRMLAPRQTLKISGALLVGGGLLAVVTVPSRGDLNERLADRELIEYLRGQSFAAGTRLYATPQRHLAISYLTGLPVQSIAPIRKTFLDNHPGAIVVIDTVNRYPAVPWERIATTAEAAGWKLPEPAARRWQARLGTRLLREDLIRQGARVAPPLEPLPRFAQAAVDHTRREMAAAPPNYNAMADNPAIFRGQEIAHRWQFWPAFFYRFVDPAARSGARLNYADRTRRAQAVVLDSAWTVFYCPGRAASSKLASPVSVKPTT